MPASLAKLEARDRGRGAVVLHASVRDFHPRVRAAVGVAPTSSVRRPPLTWLMRVHVASLTGSAGTVPCESTRGSRGFGRLQHGPTDACLLRSPREPSGLIDILIRR